MPGDDQGSITGWIASMKAGDLAAAQPLWERYFARIVVLARRGCGPRAGGAGTPPAMRKTPRSSAFDSLCAGLARGQFPQLADRDDLWRLLVVITTRKVQAQARRQLRQKRGGGKVQPACDVDDARLRRRSPRPRRRLGADPGVRGHGRRGIIVSSSTRLDDDVLRKVADPPHGGLHHRRRRRPTRLRPPHRRAATGPDPPHPGCGCRFDLMLVTVSRRRDISRRVPPLGAGLPTSQGRTEGQVSCAWPGGGKGTSLKFTVGGRDREG